MNHQLLFITLALFLTACQTENKSEPESSSPFTVLKEEALTYDNLTIYPIKANEAFIENNEKVRELIGLKEAIELDRFRITEKKPYGRFDDAGAVNSLTVQNKTEQTVFLMNGDVVQGGRQDRVLAQNRIIPPRSITDIPVFCVEKGRWEFRDQNREEENPEKSESEQRVLAFRGYYNVASSQIRRSIKHSNDQKEVWEQVSKITSANDAQSQTQAYAGLEASEEYTKSRAAYLNALQWNSDIDKTAVGWIVSSGSEILGAELFGHPDLCKKQYEAVLHSYITDAITMKNQKTGTPENLEGFVEELWKGLQKGGEGVQKLNYQGALVYFSKL